MAFGPSGNRGACVPLHVEAESEDGREIARVPSTEAMNAQEWITKKTFVTMKTVQVRRLFLNKLNTPPSLHLTRFTPTTALTLLVCLNPFSGIKNWESKWVSKTGDMEVLRGVVVVKKKPR